MFLENLVVDAVQPQVLGRFWEAALGGSTLTDAPGIFETRLVVDGGPEIDLCFQPVAAGVSSPARLALDLAGGEHPSGMVERLLGLGARRLGAGEGHRVLADPEGNVFHVVEHRTEHDDTGPVAAIRLACADPARDRAFWSWVTGWDEVGSALRHPSSRGPALVLAPESAPKGEAKNRMHLDLRLEADDDPDDVASAIAALGGGELSPAWADQVPWRLFADPSGNELCLLPARS